MSLTLTATSYFTGSDVYHYTILNRAVTALSARDDELAAAVNASSVPSPGTSGNVLTSNGSSWLSSTPATYMSQVTPGTSGNVLTSNGSSWASSMPSDSYKDIPSNSQSSTYTLILGDRGKSIDTNSGVTFPPNSSARGAVCIANPHCPFLNGFFIIPVEVLPVSVPT